MKLLDLPIEEAVTYIGVAKVYAINMNSEDKRLVDIGEELAGLKFLVEVPEDIKSFVNSKTEVLPSANH